MLLLVKVLFWFSAIPKTSFTDILHGKIKLTKSLVSVCENTNFVLQSWKLIFLHILFTRKCCLFYYRRQIFQGLLRPVSHIVIYLIWLESKSAMTTYFIWFWPQTWHAWIFFFYLTCFDIKKWYNLFTLNIVIFVS